MVISKGIGKKLFTTATGVYHDNWTEGHGVDDNVLGAGATSEAVCCTVDWKPLAMAKPAVPGVEENFGGSAGLNCHARLTIVK